VTLKHVSKNVGFMGSHVAWTERERELVEELIKAVNEGHSKPLKRAAEVVRIHYTTAKNTLYRMRNRYDHMRYAIEEYSKWRKRLKGRRYL
jgi:hypothetical protein